MQRAFTVGAGSKLPSAESTRHAVSRLAALFPSTRYEQVELRREELTDAVTSGRLDFALLPSAEQSDQLKAALDWFRLPGAFAGAAAVAEAAAAVKPAAAPEPPAAERAGAAGPGAAAKPPAAEQPVTVVFRRGNRAMQLIRSALVPAVAFVGAGPGERELCTIRGAEALGRCDLCLHDALLDPRLLRLLPPGAEAMPVGKRCGDWSITQEELNERLVTEARRGRRIVRLKGGDPGIFGRLSEELSALEELGLPYRLVPGLCSLQAGTTGTGILLTKRGDSHGFTVLSARERGGGIAPVTKERRGKLPLVLFMSTTVIDEVARQLMSDGHAPTMPVWAVYNAGSPDQSVLSGTLETIGEIVGRCRRSGPGLIIVGAGEQRKPVSGPLGGMLVLNTVSETLRERANAACWDLGGRPVALPLISLSLVPEAAAAVRDVERFDWLLVSSPSGARFLFEALKAAGIDLRRLPKIAAAGRRTAEELEARGVIPDAAADLSCAAGAGALFASMTESPAAGGRRQAAGDRKAAGENGTLRLLRLRSDAADDTLQRSLRSAGVTVEDRVLYESSALRPERLPDFHAALFASSSAVAAFVSAFGAEALAGRQVAAIGRPTVEALCRHGISDAVVAPESTVEATLLALAARQIDALLRRQP